jgi:hypothetical protein
MDEIAQLDEVEGRPNDRCSFTPGCWRRRLPSVWMLKCWRSWAKWSAYSTEINCILRADALSQA